MLHRPSSLNHRQIERTSINWMTLITSRSRIQFDYLCHRLGIRWANKWVELTSGDHKGHRTHLIKQQIHIKQCIPRNLRTVDNTAQVLIQVTLTCQVLSSYKSSGWQFQSVSPDLGDNRFSNVSVSIEWFQKTVSSWVSPSTFYLTYLNKKKKENKRSNSDARVDFLSYKHFEANHFMKPKQRLT